MPFDQNVIALAERCHNVNTMEQEIALHFRKRLGQLHFAMPRLYAYANNHYAGHAPATVELFRDLCRARGMVEAGKPRQTEKEPTLFD